MHRRPKKVSVCSSLCGIRAMMFLFLMLVLFSVFSVCVISALKKPEDEKKEIGLSFLDHYPNAIVQRNFKLSQEAWEEIDREWKQALVHNEIVDTIILGHYGLADKYIFILEGGYAAMAKPVERNLIIWGHNSIATYEWDKENPNSAFRMDRDFQGWGEIVASAMDRVLRWYRKPTVVGRFLDSKVLYYHDYSIIGRILYALPSHQVPVAMHAWVSGMKNNAPTTLIGKYLKHQAQRPTPWDIAVAFADVILFDFLLDDHDRLGSHNWMASADGKLLSWDSGLAFNYGPKHKNTELLCGTHTWNGDDPLTTHHTVERPDCLRICRFNENSILQLRLLGPNAEPEEKLGAQLQSFLAGDELKEHLCEYGIYNIRPSGFFSFFAEAGRFKNEDFFQGIDQRLEILLTHVDDCIAEFGESQVLF